VLRAAEEYLRGKGVPSPRLEAELLLASVLGARRLDLYLQFDRPLREAELSVLREMVARRARGTPAAYLTGEKEFWSLGFRVDPSVLIPRPETELLVERTLAAAPAGARVLELGTGSGAVAVALAHERQDLAVVATDVSEKALEVAAENARRHGCEGRIEFLVGSWWEPVTGRRFDVVVSNPPYVRAGEALPREVQAEPALALFAPEGEPLGSYRAILAGVPGGLSEAGALLVEAGADTAEGVAALFRGSALFGEVSVHDDLAGIPRVVEARRREPSP
jgi:release factor glutamine methyltransferase